ncbi:MAG: DUF3604 domain-containing protein [Albidovulum sp.]|nr:DUF3604 domain-containing protein [Albidovulum sp.]
MPHSTYMPHLMGKAELTPRQEFEAGSLASITLTYTAGSYGIDDTGSIRIAHRFATDMASPQFEDPAAPNFLSVEASNGAELDVRYDQKMNIRPWDKTLMVKVVRGFLKEGDQLIVRYGDTRRGSPGIRVQTFCEDTFEFRVLVDAIATYDYVELPEQPYISIVPGEPENWVAVLPTLQQADREFSLRLKGEDRWGNPSDKCDQTFGLSASRPVKGLPEKVTFRPGTHATVVPGLSAGATDALVIELHDDDGKAVCRSNPMRVRPELDTVALWGDLHGQSEETIGTNSVRDYFSFGRDRAFLDVLGHQGNDFQITNEFWKELNAVTAEYNQPGSFVTIPGYEWSGNTCLGGDRNVYYLEENRPIFRSSHALVDQVLDVGTDAMEVNALFDRLRDEDCIVHAHVGGRYSDIEIGHDIQIERALEVHSAWGTFEWLIGDAFRNGFRIGIVGNSDGHKGRPGASYPGASMFGSYGGLTCFLAEDFSRRGVFDALRRRHHYATSGNRMILETRVEFPAPAILYDQDPNMGPTETSEVRHAMMGDILQSDSNRVDFLVDLVASAPVERLVIRNGMADACVVRPYSEDDLGRRVRVLFEGARYRGRGRETSWDGSLSLSGNAVERFRPVNFLNHEKAVRLRSPTEMEWQASTTGSFCCIDIWLEAADRGTITIDTELVKATIDLADIGMEDLPCEAGGLGRRIRLYRLPDELVETKMQLTRQIPLHRDSDNAIYVSVIQEDGFQAWSSPTYVFGSAR